MNWDLLDLQKILKNGNVKISEKSSYKPKGISIESKNEVKKPTKSKYNNKKVTIDGINFDSKKEAEYYMQLKLLKRAGEIKDFGLQEKFLLQDGFDKKGKHYRPITYYADFIISHNDGSTEVVDVKASKNFKTQVYKIKKKIFEYKYPDLEIKEIY